MNRRGDVSTRILDNMLCVVKTNDASDGKFFPVLSPTDYDT